MFDNLREGLRGAMKKIVGASDINEELIDSICKDVQRSLLQSDVNVRLVISITQNLKQRALGEQPPKGLSRKDHIVTILYGELAKLLGYSGDVIKTIDKAQEDDPSLAMSFFKAGKQNVVLMLGIQGSGKTTVTAKMARWLTRHGYRVGVIDTAGRHKEEEGLLQEMSEMHKAVTPDLVLLVIDSTIGQGAFKQAEAFHKAASVGGIVITKLDGTAKGGGALAASSATGAKVMFIGTGERIDDLEQFSPTRFVGRLLGMGDIKALLEMARGLELQADENQVKRLMSGKMTIEDFYAQMESASKMGFRNIIENLGISGMVKEDKLDEMEMRMEKWRFLIQSMTKQERKDPDIINESRRKRIARGSGLPEGEIKEMIKQYNTSKTFMKRNKGTIENKGKGEYQAISDQGAWYAAHQADTKTGGVWKARHHDYSDCR